MEPMTEPTTEVHQIEITDPIDGSLIVATGETEDEAEAAADRLLDESYPEGPDQD